MGKWRTIDQFPAYRVSDKGEIQSCWKSAGQGLGHELGQEWRIVVGDHPSGYHRVTLYDGEGGRRREFVHRLVLETFVGSCPEGQEARHLDGDRSNNSLDNLTWGTPQENWRDRKRHNRTSATKGSLNARAKLDEKDIRRIRHLAESGVRQAELARRFDVCDGTISMIVNRKTWRHV